jgi:EAL domain-containing protein (putative c-di-GMP-specific phosphodiesterase class I)
MATDTCRYLRTERERNHGAQRGVLSLCVKALEAGKYSLRQKASAARLPTIKAAAVAQSAPLPDTGPPTFESLGRQLREVLANRRLHSVSLCDREGNCLWLSEGALGPDEYGLINEALEKLVADSSLAMHEITLEDGRFALFLAVRTPSAELAGMAMILADGRAFGDDTLERLSAAPVRSIMLRLAVLMKPADSDTRRSALAQPEVPQAQASPPSPLISAVQVNHILELDLSPPKSPPKVAREPYVSAKPDSLELVADPPAVPPAKPATAPLASAAPVVARAVVSAQPAPSNPVREEPAAVRAVVSAWAAPSNPVNEAPAVAHAVVSAQAAPSNPVNEAPAVAHAVVSAQAAPPNRTHEVPTLAAAPAAATRTAPVLAPAVLPAVIPAASASDPTLLLEVLPFGRLRSGGQSRRFQVLPRLSAGKRDPAALDALVLQRLMAWLATHRAAWSTQPTSFTLNLSIASLEDERFVQKISAALNSHGISPETIGFEITEAVCTQRRAQVERFLAQCEKLGSWVVIDDFSFDSQVLPLLRSKAVRLVKIDPKLTSSVLKDKLCQALVIATVQAAKVLGIHCAAKKVDSQAALQWLTAIGCDFAQGAVLAGTQTLDSLSPPLSAPEVPRPAPRPAESP